MTYRELCHRLQPPYDSGEARAIIQLVLETRFQLSLADVLCGKVTQLSANDRTDLEKIVARLAAGEPVQYVLGEAEFCGRRLGVAPGVLIPRPETEELCRWIVADADTQRPVNDGKCRVLDIGTGSGCIAVTLAAEWKNRADCAVTAWDVAEEALQQARRNAGRVGVSVSFERHDVLHLDAEKAETHAREWHLIVSNPPYICRKEAALMAPHVLDHEPDIALFVPDDDPLLFYRAIARYALTALLPGGRLYFEINPLYAAPLTALLADIGFADIETRSDQFGKARFVRATLRTTT